jgi:hypothetical protein
MKTRFNLFRRNGVFYTEDTMTGKQTSLRTKDETEAKSLLNAKNEAQRQPILNLYLARAYLTASDPAFVERTWQTVMEQLQSRGKPRSRAMYWLNPTRSVAPRPVAGRKSHHVRPQRGASLMARSRPAARFTSLRNPERPTKMNSSPESAKEN